MVFQHPKLYLLLWQPYWIVFVKRILVRYRTLTATWVSFELASCMRSTLYGWAGSGNIMSVGIDNRSFQTIKTSFKIQNIFLWNKIILTKHTQFSYYLNLNIYKYTVICKIYANMQIQPGTWSSTAKPIPLRLHINLFSSLYNLWGYISTHLSTL